MLDPDDEKMIAQAKAGGAQIVTNDRVVRRAAGALSPVEVLEKAKEQAVEPAQIAQIEGLIQLNPRDLTILAESANETYQAFQKYIPMNKSKAKLVRKLRTEGEGMSWRAIAGFCSRLWGGPWGSNQLAGMVICDKAAKELGQDFLKEPWN